jgi:hypothetical protein
MKTFIRILPLGATALAAGAAATAGVALASANGGGKAVDASPAVIAAIEAEGYAITATEREDGLLEVDATRDGASYELYVDAETGKILRAEVEDD